MCSGYYSYKSGYTPEFAGIDRFKGKIVHAKLEQISPFAVPVMLEMGKEPVFSGDAAEGHGKSKYRLMLEGAKFADTHSRVGLMPVWGLSQKLPRIIGASRAKELSLTGNYLDAETAERWGLVNRVYAPEALLPAAKKLAAEMAGVEGGLLKRMKAVIDDGLSLPLPEALKMEIQRGSANNSAVTPEAAEESRKTAMARGREQTS
jgi:enoyl-CoA hydratase/carnithine racemase